MKPRGILAFAAAILAATVAARADDAPYTFTLAGSEIALPYPAGFCAARGRYDEAARAAGTADHANLTEASYYLCTEMDANVAPSSWGFLKTPLPLDQVAPPRAALIDYFKSKIDPAEFKNMMDSATKEANAGLHDTFGKDLNVRMDVKPLDTDEVAVYWGGTVSANGTGVVACALAITVVKGHVFQLYIYRPYTGASDVVAALEQVRLATKAFVAANGG